MRPMELRHLRYFVAVAEELSITRAAQRLHISQPPLSQQIRQLEEELGVQLLQRSKSGLVLTDAGKLFLDEARATLAQASRAVDTARRASRGQQGSLRIGFVSSADVVVVPRVIPTYRRLYPQVDLALLSMNDLLQRDAVLQGHISVGVTMMQYAAPGLVFEKISDEALIVALPASHPLARLEAIAMEDLDGEPYIIMDRRVASSVHDFMIAACQRAGFSPNIVQQADHVQFNLSLVASGVGLSLLPERVLRLPRDGVTYRPLVGDAPRLDLGLLYRDEPPSPIVRGFLEVTRNAFAKGGDAVGLDASPAPRFVG
jgi:DNA-binding transcriptional LysR family regulator